MKSPLPRIGSGFLTCLTVLFLSTFLGSIAATPGAQFNVRDYGAVGDGHQLETAAFKAAIEACAAKGGGVVYVPPGNYLTGTVELKSHVTLQIEAGATLLGSENPDDYPSAENPWGETAQRGA